MGNHDATYSDHFTYDVFLLSFSEKESCVFTDYLYQALLDDGIKTIRYNDKTHSLVEKTIEESRLSMVVLCENYAYSPMCLDVLVKIIECYDAKAKQVSVIFYKVEPSDVWLQENSYAAALIEHEKNFGHDLDRVKTWRSALSRIKDLSGEYCTDDKLVIETGFFEHPSTQQNFGQASELFTPAELWSSITKLFSPSVITKLSTSSPNYPPQQSYLHSQNYPPQQGTYDSASQQRYAPPSPQFTQQQSAGPAGLGVRRNFVPQQGIGQPGQGERRDHAASGVASEEWGSTSIPPYLKDYMEISISWPLKIYTNLRDPPCALCQVATTKR